MEVGRKVSFLSGLIEVHGLKVGNEHFLRCVLLSHPSIIPINLKIDISK